MKEAFDTFLAQNKVYEEYYSSLTHRSGPVNILTWHNDTDPEDWMWSAFIFEGKMWFDIAEKWDDEYIKLTKTNQK